jgi:hypothetical protein
MRNEWELLQERLANYPSTIDKLLPTRLGNAFKAMERYGYERFQLDSQALWYELHSVATDKLRSDSDDARASVDFFVALTTYLIVLSALSIPTAVLFHAPLLFLFCLACLGLARLAYSAAVRNMTDLRYTVQALVNVNRGTLVAALGHKMPESAAEERLLWDTWSKFATSPRTQLDGLDSLRCDSADHFIEESVKKNAAAAVNPPNG